LATANLPASLSVNPLFPTIPRRTWKLAVEFLFAADFSKLTGKSVLIALGHAFFTLSLASGAMQG
jgi:SNF family Na+-dependent transporter